MEAIGIAEAGVSERPGRVVEQTDQQLVSAVRRGDDRAFEELYARYQRRIGAYVGGMVKDHGRAEDITQEVFVFALRRMRATERPIAFKPWIYEIAKNACIDAYRRRRRTEEVSFDADDRLSPADQVRLVATGPEPGAAVDAKQDVDHLFGAFGEVSDIHYEILVLREFEGLSYQDIGERMGMSRPAVESALFRARKRLGEEYDELASGARCVRVQAIIGESHGRAGRGDKRRLARHVAHCESCRRLAARAGLDVRLPARRRIAEKLAGLLPFPGFLRFRRGGEDAATAPRGGGGGGWMAHLPTLAESLNTGWSKGAAALAALLVAGGVGVSTMPSKGDAQQRPPARVAAGGGSASSRAAAAVTASERTTGATNRSGGSERKAGAGDRSGNGKGTAAQDGGNGAGGGGRAGARNSPSGQDGPRVRTPDLPAITVPGVNAPDVNDTVDDVNDAVDDATGALPDVPGTNTPNLPDVPNVPNVLDVPNVPNVPAVPAPPVNAPNPPPVNVPNPPGVPNVPNVPGVPNVPSVPDVPGSGGLLP